MFKKKFFYGISKSFLTSPLSFVGGAVVIALFGAMAAKSFWLFLVILIIEAIVFSAFKKKAQSEGINFSVLKARIDAEQAQYKSVVDQQLVDQQVFDALRGTLIDLGFAGLANSLGGKRTSSGWVLGAMLGAQNISGLSPERLLSGVQLAAPSAQIVSIRVSPELGYLRFDLRKVDPLSGSVKAGWANRE